MMFGLGTDTTAPGTATTPSSTATTPAATALPGFADGVKLWASPSTAATVLGAVAASPSTAFASQVMPFTIGVLAVPLALVALVVSMGKGGR